MRLTSSQNLLYRSSSNIDLSKIKSEWCKMFVKSVFFYTVSISDRYRPHSALHFTCFVHTTRLKVVDLCNLVHQN